MVSPVGSNPSYAHRQDKQPAQTAVGEMPTGKSTQAPGQMAKQAIAESGLTDLPKNIQGKIASSIARGIDFTALLAAKNPEPEIEVPEEVPQETVAEEPAPPIEEAPPTEEAVVPEETLPVEEAVLLEEVPSEEPTGEAPPAEEAPPEPLTLGEMPPIVVDESSIALELLTVDEADA